MYDIRKPAPPELQEVHQNQPDRLGVSELKARVGAGKGLGMRSKKNFERLNCVSRFFVSGVILVQSLGVWKS